MFCKNTVLDWHVINSDGTLVPQEILSFLTWNGPSFPNDTKVNDTCIAWKGKNLRNVPCDGYDTADNITTLGFLCEVSKK